MEESVGEMNRRSWDADERELLEEAMQPWSRLTRTWRDVMKEGREVEVKPEREKEMSGRRSANEWENEVLKGNQKTEQDGTENPGSSRRMAMIELVNVKEEILECQWRRASFKA